MTEGVRNLTESQTSVILEGFYKKYHKPEYIDPDPLLFPRRYRNSADIEAAAFIASSFALGRVNSILSFLESLFEILGPPAKGLCGRSGQEIISDFQELKYRFYSPADISRFLTGLRRVYLEYGSIENCFKNFSEEASSDPIIAGLSGIAGLINDNDYLSAAGCPDGQRNVVSRPEAGSACKRMMLFLRWVVRRDDIDPGIWDFDPALLLIPVDTHVMKVSRFLGLTERKLADIKTAKEITANLKLFDKADPVKYDFSMSRIGIHPDLSYSELEQQILI